MNACIFDLASLIDVNLGCFCTSNLIVLFNSYMSAFDFSMSSGVFGLPLAFDVSKNLDFISFSSKCVSAFSGLL